jgi:hypothetical protein
MFVKAKLEGGESVIVEFEKLKGIRQLSADVMGGRKAFPIWRKVADRHPVSNEPVLVRTRTFIRGDQITEMEVVKPIAGEEETHEFRPEAFESMVLVRSNDVHGNWTAPAGEGAVVGAQAGAEYPIHRGEDHRRYVILAWDEQENEQVRHYLDAEGAGSVADLDFDDEPADGDEPW